MTATVYKGVCSPFRIDHDEDGGQYVEAVMPDVETGGLDGNFMVLLSSYQDGARRNDPGTHVFFRSLLGKKVTITITAEDDDA